MSSAGRIPPPARLRRVRATAAAVAALISVAAVAAQAKYPIFTPENFVDTMKIVGVNFAAVNAAIAKPEFPTAKAQLIRSRERLALTITFWRDRQKDDAIKILRDTLGRMDDLDTILSPGAVDAAAASAAVKAVAAGCQACHALYREQDPATRAFRFKSGLVQ
jgi:hypothetical protein